MRKNLIWNKKLNFHELFDNNLTNLSYSDLKWLNSNYDFLIPPQPVFVIYQMDYLNSNFNNLSNITTKKYQVETYVSHSLSVLLNTVLKNNDEISVVYSIAKHGDDFSIRCVSIPLKNTEYCHEILSYRRRLKIENVVSKFVRKTFREFIIDLKSNNINV
jgi:hypothetical protein